MKVLVVVVVYVDTVEQHLTLHGFIEVFQQVHTSALTTSARTNERHDLSRRHGERNVLKESCFCSGNLTVTAPVLTSLLNTLSFF